MMRVLAVLLVILGAQYAQAQPAWEVARVRAHLVAARRFVDARDVSTLTPAQRRNRRTALAVLDAYIERGEFPVRTDDAFLGMRPRFIDARGVHCAVGEMIGQTGHEGVARKINARFEYSYVRDIDDPALFTWAREYGFTVAELARIQPQYMAPPTAPDIRQMIEAQKDTFMLACAALATPRQVTVHVAGDDVDAAFVSLLVDHRKRGVVEISAPSASTAFTRCFAAEADAAIYWPNGAFHPSAHVFGEDMTFDLSSPAAVLERRVHVDSFAERCAPRPGALARTATLEIARTSKKPIEVRVTTTPENKAIEKCIAAAVDPVAAPFRRVRQLSYQRVFDLARVTLPRVRRSVLGRATDVAARCYADGVPASVSVGVEASPDAPSFTVVTDATNETFAKCVVDQLQAWLRVSFTFGNYFRIDNTVHAQVSLPIETPAARLERAKKERAEVMRKLQEVKELRDRQIRRQRGGF